jgi:hypothetical protein
MPCCERLDLFSLPRRFGQLQSESGSSDLSPTITVVFTDWNVPELPFEGRSAIAYFARLGEGFARGLNRRSLGSSSGINGYRSATIYATATVHAIVTVHATAVHAAAIYAAAIYAAAVPDRGVSRDVGPAASIGTPVKAQATSSRDQRHIGALARNR